MGQGVQVAHPAPFNAAGPDTVPALAQPQFHRPYY